MIKIDIFSGFLGAGKTTLIKKLLEEAYKGEKLVLIENEFGDVGIDGSLFPDSGISVAEINAGCICCSLAGDFASSLATIIEQFHPDRILVEPSGVGKLSDIAAAVQGFDDIEINSLSTVVDAKKCKMYMKNFGEFFENQVEYATAIILSHTDGISEKKLDECVSLLREENPDAVLITTPWDQLTGEQIIEAIECRDTIEEELKHMLEDHEEHHHDHDCGCGHDHHHHDHDHDEGHEDHDHHHDCGHHHGDEGCHDHHHGHHEDCDHDHDHHDEHHHHDEHDHHHDHDGHDHHHDHDHDHEHHHDHGCSCGCGHDHHHGHHDADEVFTSWGVETTAKFSKDQLEEILEDLEDEKKYGMVIRAKGLVEGNDGKWIHFDYVPGEPEVKDGSAGIIGRLCVIGAEIKEDELKELFGV